MHPLPVPEVLHWKYWKKHRVLSVDKDGNISLKGKAGVIVYLDGRPSYLSGHDLANMLRI